MPGQVEQEVYAVFDLGGTRVKSGLFDENGELKFVKIRDNSITVEKTMQGAANYIDDICRKYNYRIIGAGIAFAGLVNTAHKKIIESNGKLLDAAEFDFSQWVNNRWKCKLVIDNDSRLAALGEWKFGAASGFDSLVCITIGTGFGSGAVIQSRLLRGKHFSAGSLGGHLTIDYNGELCNCGNIGCVESEASSWKLAEIVRRILDKKLETWLSEHSLILEDINFKIVFNWLPDPYAKKIVDFLISVWSAGTVNLIHAYDPQIVVFMCMSL